MRSNLEHLKKLERVINQMASQHAYLANKYQVKAFLVDVTLLILSFLLTFFSALTAFCNQCNSQQWFAAHSWVIPLSALMLLFFAFLNYGFSWRSKAQEHAIATQRLSRHRHELKSVIRRGASVSNDSRARLTEINQFVTESVPPIPERQFLKSKQHHKNKLLISRILDRNHAAPILWIRTIIFFRHSRRVLFKRITDEQEKDE